jgi:hypothetical protein
MITRVVEPTQLQSAAINRLRILNVAPGKEISASGKDAEGAMRLFNRRHGTNSPVAYACRKLEQMVSKPCGRPLTMMVMEARDGRAEV